MSTFLVSLLLFLAAPAQQTTTPNPDDLCSVQGVVIKAGTGEPLHKAAVEAMSTTNGLHQTNTAMTDAMGRFELKGLDPGRYLLSASHNGFVTQRYGQRTPEGAGAMLTLSAGQKIPAITFQMIPAAVITGHVYDEDGEPVVRAQVMAMHFVYMNGQSRLVGSGGGQTNDLGEFRLFGLPPGQYIVQATFRTNPIENSKTGQGYLPTFYPGVPDANRAAPVAVRGGDEFSGVDINLQSARTLTVKGHVFNAGCGTSLRGVMVMLQNSNPNLGQQNSGSNTNDQGAFELHNVLPGSYYLTAVAHDEGKQCIGREALEVGDADIDGVTLTAAPGVEIKGHLRLEGQPSSNPGSFSVSLFSKSTSMMFGGGSGDTVKPDGSFLLKNAFEGDYEISVGNIPENSFLKSARLDGIDVLTAGVTVDSKQAPGSLEIVVSANGANVDGVVTKDQQPFLGATVALVPDPPHRSEKRLFKSITSDQNGHFTLQGISPGDYKVFAWEKIESGAYTSSDFLQPYENLGESVHITEGSRNSVQLGLIPAKDAEQ